MLLLLACHDASLREETKEARDSGAVVEGDSADTGDQDSGDSAVPEDHDLDDDGYDGVEAGGNDCDDGNAGVSPAVAEVCDNGVDDDCDGQIGPACLISSMALEDADAPRHARDASDYVWSAATGDFGGDGAADLVVGVSNSSGTVYVASGPLASGSASLASAETTITGVGTEVALGDLDGDGIDDVAVGNYGVDNSNGEVRVFIGGGGEPSLDDTDAAVTITSADGNCLFGQALAAGDVTGDGAVDLVVGAPAYGDSECSGYTTTQMMYGRVGIFEGPLRGRIDADAPDGSLTGVYGGTGGDYGVSGDMVGYDVAAAGDVDGDGVHDLLIGSYSSGAWLTLGGAVRSGNVGSATDATFSAPADTAAGWAVSGAGDVNGDGLDDMLVGGDDAYLLLGSAVPVEQPLARADATITGASGEWVGGRVAGAGDTNVDGVADLLVGAWGLASNGAGSGAALLFLGPVSGALGVEDATAVLSGQKGEGVGYIVGGAADLGGDSADDVLVGSSQSIYVVFGGGL